MSPRMTTRTRSGSRGWNRSSQIKDLSLTYEGHTEGIPVRPSDLSPSGMFINTASHFPEGAVLRVRFRLTRSNLEVEARCEVRYCMSGVGVGVEFIGISPQAALAIAKEIRPSSGPRSLKSSRRKNSRSRGGTT